MRNNSNLPLWHQERPETTCAQPRMRGRAGVVVLAACFAAFFVTGVQAQDAGTVELSDRLERLERDIQTLNRQISMQGVNPGVAAPSISPPQLLQPGQPVIGAAPQVAPQLRTPTPSTTTSMVAQPDLPEGTIDRLMVQLSNLEQEVRGITNSMERVDYRIGLIETRLDTLVGDIDFRLSRLETGAAGGPSTLAAPGPASVRPTGPNDGTITPITSYSAKTSGAPQVMGSISKDKLDAYMANQEQVEGAVANTTNADGTPQAAETVAAAPVPVKPELKFIPEGTVQEQYKHAFNLMRRAKYVEAEQAWQEFIVVRDGEKLVENARYWLGETYYVQKRFLESAQAFLLSYQAAPGGGKGADSLFKLGKSMSNLGKKDEACAAYSKLRKEFTELSANVKQNLDRETKSLSCI